MAKGILIAAMNFSAAPEDEFHDWYDTEHLRERQRVPGFLACERWIGAHDPKISVATYELDNVDVLKSEAHRAIGIDNLSCVDGPRSARTLGVMNRSSRLRSCVRPIGAA